MDKNYLPIFPCYKWGPFILILQISRCEDEFITSISFLMKYFNFNLINIFTNHTTGFFKHNHQVIIQKAERAAQNHLQKLPLELWRFFSSVQSLSHVWLFANPWTAVHQASLSITNFWNLLKLHVHWVGDAIQPSHSLLSPSPPAFNLS